MATLGPALSHEFQPNPILGEGFGTRVTSPDAIVRVPNRQILDDQWLGVLLETGVVGTLTLAWLFLRSLRWMGGIAKRDLSPRGWLLVGTTASTAGYAVGMLFYDAFSFVQVTFLLLIILALGASTALSSPEEWTVRGATRLRAPVSGVDLEPRELEPATPAGAAVAAAEPVLGDRSTAARAAVLR